MLLFLRTWFWSASALMLLVAPIAVSKLLEIRQTDPSRCTLDAKTCDRLRNH